MADNPRIDLQLNPDGVAAPAQLAATVCREVVDLYFDALNKADLSKKPEAPENEAFFRFDSKGPDFSAEQRRAIHETWILSKAFQDLMRGVRASLDEAYFFIQLLDMGHLTARTSATVEEILRPYRQKAVAMKFPVLLAAVNARLDKPLEFAAAYQSMQDARNCLEHRGGNVGQIDAKTNGKMVLQFPRMMMFVEQNGERIELYSGFRVEAGQWIMGALDLRRREYEIGQRLTLTAADFEEIAFACSHFAGQLATNLSR
jgi:hypothetical protein